MAKTKTSGKRSFDYWSIYVWLKGRKRSLITSLAALIVYFLSDEALAAIISGLVIEGAFAIGDYYFSSVEVKQ